MFSKVKANTCSHKTPNFALFFFPQVVKTGIYLNKCLSSLMFFTQPSAFQLQLKAIFHLSIREGKFPAFPSFAQVAGLNWTCCLLVLGDAEEINGLTQVFMRNQSRFKLVVIGGECLHLLKYAAPLYCDHQEEKWHQMLRIPYAWSLPF